MPDDVVIYIYGSLLSSIVLVVLVQCNGAFARGAYIELDGNMAICDWKSGVRCCINLYSMEV